jgi:hypothetical protein
MIRVHDFDGPEEFLEAMRSADIVRKHRNLIYVQGLKLLQTGGGRGGRRVTGGPAPRAKARPPRSGGGGALGGRRRGGPTGKG